MASPTTPKIKLYTNHGCPWAHRAHIALIELNLPYEEEIIDLSVPRDPSYLKVNPRGLVPSLEYDGEIITESAIVSQFLVDAHPSHLLPASNEKGGALRRARINFFVDTYFSKAQGLYHKTLTAKTDEEAEATAEQFVAVIVKELEPLLSDAKPFFGGSERLTLAEVLTGSFLLRLFTLTKHGVTTETLTKTLPEKAPNFYAWAQNVIKQPSVTFIYDEESVAEKTKERLKKLRAA